jgi:hypothetical protein
MENKSYPVHKKFDTTDTPDESIDDLTHHAELEDNTDDLALSQIDVVDASSVTENEKQLAVKEEVKKATALAGLRKYINKILPRRNDRLN